MQYSSRKLFGVSALCGVLAALLSLQVLSSQQRQDGERASILVTAKAIKAGMPIGLDAVKERSVPKDCLMAGMIQAASTGKPDFHHGLTAPFDLSAGHPLYSNWRRQASLSDGFILPPGTRAVTVKLKEASVARLLKPGDLAEIFGTGAEAGPPLIATVLSLIPQDGGRDAGNKPPAAAVVQVTRAEAGRIARLQARGADMLLAIAGRNGGANPAAPAVADGTAQSHQRPPVVLIKYGSVTLNPESGQ
jgi:Flp pilus assembly protein CpaB